MFCNYEARWKGTRAVEIPTAETRRVLSPLWITRFFSSVALWLATCFFTLRMVNGITGNLEKYMDVLAARQKLVASNIANVDTPGYQTKDLDFQSEFNDHLNGGSVSGGQDISGLRNKNDGNNVSLDREARLLSENAIRFSAAENLIKGQFRILKTAIHEGQA